MALNMSAWDQQLMDISCIYNKSVQRFDDKISGWFWQHFEHCSLKYKHYNKKIKLQEKLTECLTKYYNGSQNKFIGVFFMGSMVTGLATTESDLDLCVFVSDNFFDYGMTKNKKIQFLSEIEEILLNNNFKRENSEIIDARVPILRYVDKEFDTKVEISLNNEFGIRNTRLLYCYSKLDWRVSPLCITIKSWAKYNKVIDSFNGYLSSYAVELMVIFFLQNCSPPVLPCLQQTDYQHFSPIEEIDTYVTLPDISELTAFDSENTESLSQLFVGFFDYYTGPFDLSNQVVSVRRGKPFFKTVDSDSDQWELIAIEEPFSYQNAARTVYEVSAYNRIVHKFEFFRRKMSECVASECNRSQNCKCK